MNINICRMLLRRRWPVVALIALFVFVYEALEHFSMGSIKVNPNFVGEILIFSVALPILFGTVLTLLTHTYLNPVSKNAINTQSPIKERVLVVENHLLMGAGLEDLLNRETNFEIIGVAPRTEEELLQRIKKLRPTTIILDEATYLTHSVRLLAYLRLLQKCRLVIVNANSNLIHIYHKQNFLLTQTKDFIEVLS